jgi:hypothetical protein
VDVTGAAGAAVMAVRPLATRALGANQSAMGGTRSFTSPLFREVNLLHSGTRASLTGGSPGVRDPTPASTLGVFDPY